MTAAEQCIVLTDIMKILDTIKSKSNELDTSYQILVSQELRNLSDSLSNLSITLGNTRSKMLEFFRLNLNRPATIKEIVKSTNSTHGSVIIILYKRDFGQFEKCGTKPVVWRIKQGEQL